MVEISVCEAPITRGSNKGQSARGTNAGYYRHRRVGEPVCDDCAKARTSYMVAWHAAHPDAEAAFSRTWRLRNPIKARSATRRWRDANPETMDRARRRWLADNVDRVREANRLRRLKRYRENPEREIATVRRWQAANPEKVREIGRRRKARQADALTIPFTAEQLADRMAYWGNRCYLRIHCEGAPYEQVDHVIPIALGGPHCLSNLRPACSACNPAKGARRLAQLA